MGLGFPRGGCRLPAIPPITKLPKYQTLDDQKENDCISINMFNFVDVERRIRDVSDGRLYLISESALSKHMHVYSGM